MKKFAQIYILFLMFVFCTICNAQNETDLPVDNFKSEIKITSPDFHGVTRNLIQDRNGNIWIATFGGVFRYDGKSFANVTSKVSSARFFSVLEDRKGNFWFSTIGSGVYYYDGKSFRNFTTKEGLPNNRVTDIYEDKNGNIWFGTERGASYYDGKFFQNFTTNEGLPHNEVTSIIEDKKGNVWFGTRGGACFYDGKTFIIFTRKTYANFTNKEGLPFRNVRSIIEDRKGNIWLGGEDGLWRYEDSTNANFGSSFTNFTQNFVGYIYEDKNGNIWTSSESANAQGWVLSRYEEKSLSNKKPNVTEVNPRLAMLFGILEDDKGNIWFGAGGVYRYDGNTITDFKGKEGHE